MHSQSFGELRGHLLASGVALIEVERITAELGDHLEDLRLEAQTSGLSAADAMVQAETRLGDQKVIAERLLARTEFRTWIYRYPRVARIYLPLAYAVLLPASPVFAGLANPSLVVRWCVALMVSSAITATMLLCMQLAFVLN